MEVERRFSADELSDLLERATTGPWKATHRHVHCSELDDERDGLGLEIEGPESPMLRGQFSRSADARLIAAAPDLARQLLDCLQFLASYIDD